MQISKRWSCNHTHLLSQNMFFHLIMAMEDTMADNFITRINNVMKISAAQVYSFHVFDSCSDLLQGLSMASDIIIQINRQELNVMTQPPLQSFPEMTCLTQHGHA